MLGKLLNKILEQRHYWRYASFSEIAELYASRTFRMIGIHIAAGFAGVYLYQTGYSLIFIIGYWGLYFLFKQLVAYFSALFASYFGPKHGILISNLLYIPAMVALGFVPNYGLSALIVWGVCMAVSVTLYELCYLTDFSKIKSADHAGKELGFMNILEKLAIGVSPIIGGLIALAFGPQIVMWVGAVIFGVAALPLLATGEQTATRQKLNLKAFPWKLARRSLIAQAGMGFDSIATGYIWVLFVSIVIFSDMKNEIYVNLGVLSAVMIITAIVISYVYGKLIDKQKGGYLLKVSVVLNALTHAFRPFVASPASAVSINIANEAATTGVTMPYIRGMFDIADLSGNRIAYLYFIELASNFGAMLSCVVAIICVALLGDIVGLQTYFFITAFAVLSVATVKFPLYRK